MNEYLILGLLFGPPILLLLCGLYSMVKEAFEHSIRFGIIVTGIVLWVIGVLAYVISRS